MSSTCQFKNSYVPGTISVVHLKNTIEVISINIAFALLRSKVLKITSSKCTSNNVKDIYIIYMLTSNL